MKKVFIFAATVCLSGCLFARNHVYVDAGNRLQIQKVQTDDPYVRNL